MRIGDRTCALERPPGVVDFRDALRKVARSRMSAHDPDFARLEFPFSRADALDMEGAEAPVANRAAEGAEWA
jgi:hypothetical protein